MEINHQNRVYTSLIYSSPHMCMARIYSQKRCGVFFFSFTFLLNTHTRACATSTNYYIGREKLMFTTTHRTHVKICLEKYVLVQDTYMYLLIQNHSNRHIKVNKTESLYFKKRVSHQDEHCTRENYSIVFVLHLDAECI